MSKKLKTILYEELKKRFQTLAEGCVLIDYQHINSEKTHDLRSQLRQNGVRMNVVHNRLARRVCADKLMSDAFQQLFRGPTAVLFGKDGALSASKCLAQWRKKNKDLAPIKGGLFQGKALSPAEVGRLAALPDVSVLQQRAAGLFLAPLTHLATVTQGLLSHFPSAVKSHREALEKQGGPAETPVNP